MNINSMEAILCCESDSRLTQEQQVVGDLHISKGWEVYLESYSDYTYLVMVKLGVRKGIKRINKTGHNTYVG